MILPWAICTPRVALGVGMSLPGSLQSDHTCLWAGRTGGAPRRGQPMHPVRSQCPSAIVKWAHGKACLLPEHCHSGLSREMRDRIPIPQSRGEWGKHCNFWDWGVRKETWHERSWDAGSWVRNGSEFSTGGRDKGYYRGLQTLGWHFPRKLENLKKVNRWSKEERDL